MKPKNKPSNTPPDPNNEIVYNFNFQNDITLRNYFKINDTTGELTVELLGGNILDRDNGIPDHIINIIVEDNYSGIGREL